MIRIGICFLWLVFLTVQSVYAYIPPSQFIIEKVTSKKEGLKFLVITSEVQQMENGQPTGLMFTETTQLDFSSGIAQSRIVDDNRASLFEWERRFLFDGWLAQKTNRKRERAISPSFFDQSVGISAHILWSPSVEILSVGLKRQGVPVRTEEDLMAIKDESERRKSETLFVRRWEGMMSWVIGDARSKSDAQFWIQKDTFLPLRWLHGGAGSQVEIQFKKYSFQGTVPYPREIALVKDGAEIMRVNVIRVVNNAKDPQMSTKITPGAIQAMQAKGEGFQELVQTYYRYMR